MIWWIEPVNEVLIDFYMIDGSSNQDYTKCFLNLIYSLI